MVETGALLTQGSFHHVGSDHQPQAPPVPLPAGFARNLPPGLPLSLQECIDLYDIDDEKNTEEVIVNDCKY